MYHKNTLLFRITSRVLLALFLANNITPTLQFAFAAPTQYYVDATGGSDLNNGTSPATPWQTLAKVNSTPLLQGDTVSLLCSESWAENLNLNAVPGAAGLPITINNYGSCVGNTATIEGVNISNSAYVVVDGIDVSNALPGSIFQINTSNNITVQNTTVGGLNATCFDVNSATGIIIDGNAVSVCQNAMSISGSEATVSNNTISNIITHGIHVVSTYPVTVSYNTILNVGESAILYASNTNVLRNNITTVCTTGSTECAAIRNSPFVSGGTTSQITENSIKDVGTGVSALSNAGILTKGVDAVDISKNGIQNTQYAVRIIDSANTVIAQNTLLFSRINALSVLQYNTGATSGNSFTGNTFLQRAPDYPYIEMRDEVPGTGVVTGFMSFTSNNIFPNYKPNTAYARTVKFGGETVEYTKAALTALDPTITKFEYFGYKPYVNTGSHATANLLTNGDFSTDASNWTASALSGSAPSIGYNPTGTYVGGSTTITPGGGSADRIWITNNPVLSITSGQVFHVTGYANSSSGNLNLRVFLHSSSDKNLIYSDRIAETYASSTGGLFSFYITATATAADAQLTLETSNNDVAYEIDSISLYRMAAHVKNTNSYEVLAFENATGFSSLQGCPGGAQCFAYVDGINSPVSWSITIPAHSTSFVLWNNSPNIMTPPVCSMNLSSGSVPTGQPVDVTWNSTGSLLNSLAYDTYTGSINEIVFDSGSRTFIPPYDAVTTISLNLVNDVGPSSCSVQVITTNTAPSIYPSTITGSEDDPQINGTLSGIDLNPGDSVFFEKFTDPTYGIINVDSTGSIQYFPLPDFCGTDTFLFRASDQLGHYADPISQNIDVECVNDAPVAVDDSGSTNGPMVSVDVLANDTDVDNVYTAQTFSIASFTQPMSGSVVQNGNNLEYTPLGSFSGADIFMYRLQDQSGALSSNTGIVTIHVVLPNMAPQAHNMNLTINEDTILNDVLSGSDLNGDTLSFTALTLPSSGALNLLANGNFSYTPVANIYGTDTFDFIANDGFYDSNTGTVTITINSVPDAPVGIDDSYSLNQDTSISVPVLTNDYDVDSVVLSITGITSPAHGIATLSGATIYYVPNLGYSGPDSFTYLVQDDTSLTSTPTTVNMTVVFTNAAPTANAGSFSVNEDVILSGAVSGSDPEMSTLTYVLDSTTTNGSLTLSSTGGFRYTPNANYNGGDSFSFHVSDGILSSTSATINITVNSVNDIPTANTATITAVGNSVVSLGNVATGSLTGNDIEGSPLTFTAGTLPVHGLLTMTSTGYFTYTPAVGYIGTDSFTFHVNDGIANSSNVTVNINVTSNGIPIPLGYFSIVAPSSAYSGTLFGVTVQARDLAGNIMTNYTGSITFTSSDSLAVLPASGASITFNPGDAGVKTFSNSIIFYTLGTINLHVQDTILSGASGSANISVSIPAISVPAGPGGGISMAINGIMISTGSGNEQNLVLGSAPAYEPQTRFQFVGEGAELLNKLMLVNRIVRPDGSLTNSYFENQDGQIVPGDNNTSNTSEGDTYLMNLQNEDLQDDMSTLTLRIAFWDHLHRAVQSTNPDRMFESARTKLDSFTFEDDDRDTLVRDVLLRILDLQQRKYREIVDRDVAVYSPSTKNDASVSLDTNTDTTSTDPSLSELDLSNIDLSELNLTDEELALLQM